MKIESSQSTAVPQENEISQEVLNAFELLKQKVFMFRHFIDGLINKKFIPISKEEVEKIVDDNFFSFEPMVNLNFEQEKLLRYTVIEHIYNYLNHEQFRCLCGDVYKSEEGHGGGNFVTDKYFPVGTFSQMTSLPLQEKLNLFDVKVWAKARIGDGGGSSPLVFWGNRSLKNIRFSDEEWAGLVDKAKVSTGKKDISILDIGCGLGKAMEDMRRIDPTADIHGITLEQEPGMFDSGKFHYIAAERMPAEFKNRFDLILSNLSFRYHLFPNLSLRNAILALSVGGHAEIGFSYDRIPDEEIHDQYFKTIVPDSEWGYEAMKEIIKKDWDKIKRLESEGKLKINTHEGFGVNNDYYGWIKIDKLQELEPEDFL